jgi:hypothetical protein
MIRKIKHPSNRGERLALERKKKVHSNASPVYKLLQQRELTHRDFNLDILSQKGKENE